MAFLEINDVRKQFAQTSAVELFNLQVERGEFVSFLGPSGCGKTTTLRMIAGLEEITSGEIWASAITAMSDASTTTEAAGDMT